MNTDTPAIGIAKHRPWLRYGLAGLIGCLGLAFALAAFMATRTWESRIVANDFERVAGDYLDAPQRAIDLYMTSIRELAQTLGKAKTIDAEVFRQQARQLRAAYPAIATLIWVPRVSDEQRGAYVAAMRAGGFPEFDIIEHGDGQRHQTAPRRQRYFPMTYLEPLLRSLPGLNMAAHPDWLLAMERARDGALPTIVDLRGKKAAPSTQLESGVFLPVYAPRGNDTTQARRDNLRGFLVAVLQVQSIVLHTLEPLRQQRVEIRISDGTTEPADGSTLLRINSRFQLAGRSWLLVMTPTNEFVRSARTWWPWMVLASGLLLTALLLMYLLTLRERAERVENMVTERTRALSDAYDELKNSQIQLIQSEKMATIGQMVAGMVHEINTPLGYVNSSVAIAKDNLEDLIGLLGEFERLGEQAQAGTRSPELDAQWMACMAQARAFRDDSLDEETRMLLQNGLDGLQQMAALVRNLKDFSRLDREQVANHDINKGLDDALRMIHHKLKGRIEVVTDYGDIPPVKCAPAQINQVFLNLLVNAVHAILDVRENGTINVITEADEEYVYVIIADDGKGMSETQVERVFEPFFTTKQSGEGTGLGLAIVRKIIKEHRGEISVESSEGEGSYFTVSLPLN